MIMAFPEYFRLYFSLYAAFTLLERRLPWSLEDVKESLVVLCVSGPEG